MEKARDAMRRQVGYYASTPAYRPVLDLHGWGDLQSELYACSKEGRWDGHGPPRRRRGARHADHRLRSRRPGRRGRLAATGGWSTASTSRGGARSGGPTSRRSCAPCDDVRRCRETWRRATSPSPRCSARVRRVVVGERRAAGRPGRRWWCVLRLRRRRVRGGPVDGRDRTRPGLGGGHAGRRHVGDEGPDDAVRARARGPGRARPRRAGRPVLARVRVRGQGVDHRAPAAQPPVGRHRAPRVRRAAVVGRRGVGRHGRHRRRRRGGGAGLGAGDPPRLPRRDVRVAGRRAGAPDQRVQPRARSSRPRWPGHSASPARSPSGHRPPRSGRWPPSWSSRCARARRARCGPSIPTSRSGRSVLAGAHGSLFADEEGRPRFAEFMNTPAVLQAEIGALGATAHGAGAGPRLRRPGDR